jgi:hypothetical protein
MAWLGTVLWVTGASYLVVSEHTFWNNYSPAALLYVFIVVAGAAGFAFVRFQFKRRERAAAWSNSCLRVAATWARTAPTEDEIEPAEVEPGIWFPRAVTDEATRQLNSWRGFNGPRRSEYLAYLIMAVFAIMVIVRAATG